MKKLVLAKWDNELERHIGAEEIERLENIEWANHATHVFFCGIWHSKPSKTADEHRSDWIKINRTRTNSNVIAAYINQIDWDQVSELSKLSQLQKDIVARGNKTRYDFILPITA